MQDFEKLGVFYLGKDYDLQEKKTKDNLILYESKDLVTHGVCVGMTGSGKTGLCIALLEEAAIDSIPALIIDPKGDLTNLLLTFPDLKPEDFRPWLNEDDARKKGLSPDDYAANQSELWKNGLANWGQDGDRIRRLKDTADFVIYTPGSSAGQPISILQSFAAPPDEILNDEDALRENISVTATSLLGLMGIEADPIKSREHILISTILKSFWQQKKNLDLVVLIQSIQSPPFAKVGVFDLDAFYPAKERFELAMSLNNILAAPGFETWLQGEPLKIDKLLYTESGKPRHAIFYIAHLADSERMFFASLLLNQVINWMRTQPGTTSLRTLIYIDEIFGYLPPVANPPSKLPLLTLLKQGRAFGVGVMLATQNPVDLDYKALANTGTWFLGRLQTERDKARVLDGLAGVASTSGAQFDRSMIEKILSSLNNRVFLMHNVHEDAPVVFQSRWALSYLCGPMTRVQIKNLTAGQKPQVVTEEKSQPTPAGIPIVESVTQHPTLPPDIREFYLPVRSRTPENARLLYQPQVVGFAKVQFLDPQKGIDLTDKLAWLAGIDAGTQLVDWENARSIDFEETDLTQAGEENARFSDPPTAAKQAKNFAKWEKTFSDEIFRLHKIELLKSPLLNSTSKPGESERDFRIRLTQQSREQRDTWTEELRKKYAQKMAAIEEKIRRAQQRVDREKSQAKQQQYQTAISLGSTLLSAFIGRKAVSLTTMGRATTSLRDVGRTIRETSDIGQAQESVEFLQQQLQELEDQFKSETAAYAEKIDPQTETLETIAVRPKKTGISTTLLAFAWSPYWQNPDGTLQPAWE